MSNYTFTKGDLESSQAAEFDQERNVEYKHYSLIFSFTLSLVRTVLIKAFNFPVD